VRASYDTAAAGWASGPGPVYTRLAEALIAAAPVPLAGRRVLDLGAGTGAAGRAALAAGAGQVVAADLATGMLRVAGAGLHPVAGDAQALPFRAGSFDLVAAAFCLNHLPDGPGRPPTAAG
jgi:ubiquinone/menaquinone biosynthesis C-methylase UbiE